MTVADRVRESREKMGLSQEELAHRMGLKSRSSITRIEKSGDFISLKDVERLSQILNVSVLYLMGWENRSIENIDTSDDKVLREAKFSKLYAQLNDDQKKIVDDMILALSEKK